MLKCEQYVTCFDSNFVPQGLALYKSLCEHNISFSLWVICIDRKTKEIIERCGFGNLKPLLLEDLETPELLAVKKDRSKAEYIWTLSPYFPTWIFNQDPGIERVTFLDADMFFFSNPEPIFKELEKSGKSILITEHAYDKEYENSKLLGRFCVQFISYLRFGSEDVIEWWRQKCIEWCYARCEEGKFGDQKYLDEWVTLFPTKVHVLTNNNYILAPWNRSRYSSGEMILWHFHSLRILKHRKILLHAGYEISNKIDNEVYKPYVDELKKIILSELWGQESPFEYHKLKQQIIFFCARIVRSIKDTKLYSFKSRIKIIKY